MRRSVVLLAVVLAPVSWGRAETSSGPASDQVVEDRVGGDRAGDDRVGENRVAEDRVGDDQVGEDRVGDDQVGESRVERDLPPDGAVGIDAATLSRPAVFELTRGEAHLNLRLTPDGLLEFLEADVGVGVFARGAEGNLVSVELRRGERISVWPVERIVVRAGADAFTVYAAAGQWAFVVRADKVRRGGLPARCDDLRWTFRSGERLDTDRLGTKVVFRATGATWPGSLVTAQPDKPTKKAPAQAGEGMPEPVSPGVVTGRARDFPWQSVPLPVVTR